eukprot:scaffold148_cov371-Prasinococcus_capsulatus_cf.AAC.9
MPETPSRRDPVGGCDERLTSFRRVSPTRARSDVRGRLACWGPATGRSFALRLVPMSWGAVPPAQVSWRALHDCGGRHQPAAPSSVSSSSPHALWGLAPSTCPPPNTLRGPARSPQPTSRPTAREGASFPAPPPPPPPQRMIERTSGWTDGWMDGCLHA